VWRWKGRAGQTAGRWEGLGPSSDRKGVLLSYASAFGGFQQSAAANSEAMSPPPPPTTPPYPPFPRPPPHTHTNILPIAHLIDPSSSGASSVSSTELPPCGSRGASQLCCGAPLQAVHRAAGAGCSGEPASWHTRLTPSTGCQPQIATDQRSPVQAVHKLVGGASVGGHARQQRHAGRRCVSRRAGTTVKGLPPSRGKRPLLLIQFRATPLQALTSFYKHL
jgi:hypothetical protein